MKPTKETGGALRKWIRPLAFGILSGAAACLLTLLLLAALLTAQDIPQVAIMPLALVAATVGAFVGGFVSGRLCGQNGWLIGAAAGLGLFLLLVIAGAFSMFSNSETSGMWLKLAIMPVTGAVGGIVAVNVRKK